MPVSLVEHIALLARCSKLVNKTFIQLRYCVLQEAVRGAPPPDKKLLEHQFVFACVWAFGGCMLVDKVSDYRTQFSKWWISEYKNVQFPEKVDPPGRIALLCSSLQGLPCNNTNFVFRPCFQTKLCLWHLLGWLPSCTAICNLSLPLLVALLVQYLSKHLLLLLHGDTSTDTKSCCM